MGERKTHRTILVWLALLLSLGSPALTDAAGGGPVGRYSDRVRQLLVIGTSRITDGLGGRHEPCRIKGGRTPVFGHGGRAGELADGPL